MMVYKIYHVKERMAILFCLLRNQTSFIENAYTALKNAERDNRKGWGGQFGKTQHIQRDGVERELGIRTKNNLASLEQRVKKARWEKFRNASKGKYWRSRSEMLWSLDVDFRGKTNNRGSLED